MSKIILDTDAAEASMEDTVLVGGCFDVLHPGHIKFLNLSKKLGKNLVVLLESDINIRNLKGKNRPMNTQSVRAENLSNNSAVDYIILLKKPDSSQYYYNLVKSVHPGIIAVTEGDPLLLVKKDQARLVSGQVVSVMKRNENYSSTKIINNKK